ncbi:MAG TPA: M13 family metallopeptidase [Candidatus Angelobacter sp.]|nr:M13 family metallopeptidase [Candidatus Angelobacter sp.]
MISRLTHSIFRASAVVVLLSFTSLRGGEAFQTPGFSVAYMDRSVPPAVDFYRFADGDWLKNNPVPADKSRWGAFNELQERNWQLIHSVLESCAGDTSAAPKSPAREVGDLFASALDTNLLEQLRFKPLARDLKRIARLRSTDSVFRLLADFHQRGIGGFFSPQVEADPKDSSIYALRLAQGGLGLPDRDYYLKDTFTRQRDAYRAHITTMLKMLGEPEADAARHAVTVLDIETSLAQASKTRVEMRDPVANYHKFSVGELERLTPALPWKTYLRADKLDKINYLVVGQPEFLKAEEKLVIERPLADWQVYLRWHLLRSAAPYLHHAAESENFAFYQGVLSGTQQPEPRWQRAAHVIDGSIGEALGRLYVEKYFPPAARARMNELIANLKSVFRDRLKKIDWMTDGTRAKALAKFDRFTQKIGYPDKFRDYSSVKIVRDDYWGNVQRASQFESRRQFARVGKPVDRSEWEMTPQTVNAYFNPSQNEIVFPAGILQPPFFDAQMDDAVNYGAIGVVIGHEITHGYDDEGRKYDADGNLNEWWSAEDGRKFEARAQKVVDQYNSYEALPGFHVNGKLTLGENIADLGGTSIAYEALQRALAKDPSKRKAIDGFTPEQRFFLSLAQIWRTNWREDELKRRLTVDPHSPGQFRAIGPHVNMEEFYKAFDIKPGDPMYRPAELRAKIW